MRYINFKYLYDYSIIEMFVMFVNSGFCCKTFMTVMCVTHSWWLKVRKTSGKLSLCTGREWPPQTVKTIIVKGIVKVLRVKTE